jgi:hypothetical protein
MTLSFFDKGKIEQFIPYALLEVNNTPAGHPPSR